MNEQSSPGRGLLNTSNILVNAMETLYAANSETYENPVAQMQLLQQQQQQLQLVHQHQQQQLAILQCRQYQPSPQGQPGQQQQQPTSSQHQISEEMQTTAPNEIHQPTHQNVSKRKRSDNENLAPPVYEYEYNVPTSSRYEALQSLNSENNSEPIIKIPPMIMHNVEKYDQIISDIKSVAKSDFTTKSTGTQLKIMFTTIEDYRTFRHYCVEKNKQFYSFRDPTQKVFNAVLKGIPTCYSEADILKELDLVKFPVIKVTRLYDKKKNPIEICALEIKDTNEAKTIYKLNRLMHCVVQVQPRINRNNPIQCKRCQRFGHSQANCHLTPRCVKCKDTHHYKECLKPETTKPTCVNCGGEHTANYKGCRVFKEIQARRNPHIERRSGQEQLLPPSNATRTPTVSNTREFPPLPKRPAPWSPVQHTQTQMPIDISQLITTIVSQVIAAIIPQIQTIIQSMLNNNQNGK